MAITKIWDVKDSLNRAVDYISNDNKTSIKEINELENILGYISQDSKTDNHLVSSINCSVLNSIQEMNATKKLYGKTDKILAFHAVQSFLPNEASPTLAHKIGIELANAIWSNFEVVIATHVDKDHIHNHFVINSVSFKDGKKYYDNKTNYRKLQETSDQLCKEYGLSIVESNGHGVPYVVNKASKEGRPTYRSMLIEIIEQCLDNSRTMNEFYKNLQENQLEIKHGKHLAVKPP